jgi:hypothetical protein
MPEIDKVGPVVRKVGLMALHDRAFFAQLLENPRTAIESRGDLVPKGIRDEVIRHVEELVTHRSGRPVEYYLERWDRYNETGEWDDDWLLRPW